MDEMCSMSRGIAKIMSFVLPLCLTAPLIWAGATVPRSVADANAADGDGGAP